MFRDSSTGTPVDPPVSNGNNGSGGNGTTPPEPPPVEIVEVPPPKIVSMQLVSKISGYSREGERPNLAGLTVRVEYEDGEKPAENLTVGSAAGPNSALFGTTPAIMGYDQLNNSNIASESYKIAASTWIDIYPIANPGKTFRVEVPGVQALSITSRGGTTAAPADADGTVRVVGAARADFDNFTLNSPDNTRNYFKGITIYEDEYNAAPAISANIRVRYHPLYASTVDLSKGKDTTSAVSTPATDPNHIGKYPIPQNEVGTRISEPDGFTGWQSIPLTNDHLFGDYLKGFPGNATFNADSNPYLPYGIDLGTEEIAFLISRGSAGKHGGANNNSIYILVPFELTQFYYVRDIKVTGWGDKLAGEDVNKKEYEGFFIQTELVQLADVGEWNDLLVDNKIEFTVFYNDPTATGNTVANTIKERKAAYFDWARKLSPVRASVTNVNNVPRIPTPVVSDADNDNFGLVNIGYYTSLLDDESSATTRRNPINYGDLGGFEVYNMPIAVFQEGTAKLMLRPNAVHPLLDHDGMLKLVVARDQDNAQGARITQAQYEAIANTYMLVGEFYHEATNTTVVMELLDLRKPIATNTVTNVIPGWFGALATTEVNEEYELSINIRNIPGGLGNLFNGQEVETLIVKLYPRDYDTTAVQQP